MKLGLGLYKSILTRENFQFARQAGATHIVAQLVDYIKGENPTLTKNYLNGWGETRNQGKLWSYEELSALRKEVESHGLKLEAIENFDPSHWYDVLLDGPEKEKQLEGIKTIIRNMGKAGIPVLGYYFSLAGVWGWTSGPQGRGNATAVGFDKTQVNVDQPIPKGMVWNMRYEDEREGVVAPVSRDEMWARLKYFLDKLIPVAEENNVRLVAHPDDPPLPEMRGTARLFYNADEYEKLLTLSSSPANGFEFCMGTIQEMQGSDVYALLDKYSREKRIGYIHFRNVIGKVPKYREAFVDEGDIDMVKALRILHANNYKGVLIPDHTPEMSTKAGWHSGMAYALGYMKGAMQAIKSV
ncbi:MAG: mannonate dehydratase [Cyclobacteriaceae bacterium]|nr:mannonate dehydratase [Cyclobacteriaceae bacterium]